MMKQVLILFLLLPAVTWAQTESPNEPATPLAQEPPRELLSERQTVPPGSQPTATAPEKVPTTLDQYPVQTPIQALPPPSQEKLPAFSNQTQVPGPQTTTPQTIIAAPQGPDEIQLANFKSCVDDAHRVKMAGLWYAQQSQFENAMKYFNVGRDAYNTCAKIIPNDWISYFFLPEGFRLAKRDYLMDFADLFFQFALLQQDDENKLRDINLAIGAMQQALERLDEACEVKQDESCNAKRQSYYTVMADSYRLNQNVDEALNYFVKADGIVKDDPANLSFWGLALYEKGMTDDAYAKWDLAIQKDPTSPAAAMEKQFKRKKKK